jgi:hypothetical protein
VPAGVNYTRTFIAVAHDCPVDAGTVPPPRAGAQTVAGAQYAMVKGHPYTFTSEDVIFRTSSVFRGLDRDAALEEVVRLRAEFFGRPRACMRASPLPKRFGWGLHCDEQGRLALYGLETDEYRRLSTDPSLEQRKALRSSRG